MHKILVFLLLFLNGCVSANWTIQNNKNHWWFISPQGKQEFLVGVTTVPAKDANRIKSYGFKCEGAWSEQAPDVPYSKDLNLFISTTVSISDPRWETQIEQLIKNKVVPQDHNLIGYYTDNEMDWQLLEKDAERYFEITHRLLKTYDPNHLILGVRFSHMPPISVLKATIGRVDCNSYNSYTDAGEVPGWIFDVYANTQIPLYCSETTFYSPDNQSGNKNIKSFGGYAETQTIRAEKARLLLERNAAVPFIIGTDWFQWQDEPPQGRARDGEDLNCGIIDIHGHVYPLLAQKIKETSLRVNSIHARSDVSSD